MSSPEEMQRRMTRLEEDNRVLRQDILRLTEEVLTYREAIKTKETRSSIWECLVCGKPTQMNHRYLAELGGMAGVVHEGKCQKDYEMMKRSAGPRK
jgi:hypothetical protein